MFSKIRGMFRKKEKQYTFLYCPKCGEELISSDSFVRDDDGIIKFKCSNCDNVSFWDFIHFPVPQLRTCEFCRHLSTDSYGIGDCDEDCAPDTQVKFEIGGCEYCNRAKPLAIGKTDDIGIAIYYPNKLNAYGYDIHGSGSNGLTTKINYCPMCGKKLHERVNK